MSVSQAGVLSTLHWSSNWTQHYTPEDEVISTNNKKYVIGQFLYSWGSNEKIKNQCLCLWHWGYKINYLVSLAHPNEKIKYRCLYLWHLILYPQHINNVNSNVNHISLQNQHFMFIIDILKYLPLYMSFSDNLFSWSFSKILGSRWSGLKGIVLIMVANSLLDNPPTLGLYLGILCYSLNIFRL